MVESNCISLFVKSVMEAKAVAQYIQEMRNRSPISNSHVK